jgi:lipoprotein signal peptidase
MNAASAAKQRRERRWLIGSSIFIALVILAALVLTSIGHTEDPFASMSDIVDMHQMLAETNQSNPVDVLTDFSDTSSVPANSIRNAGITWSAFGDVLYDLWFICAATAVIIVFSYLMKWLKGLSLLKRRLSSSPTSSPTRLSRKQAPPTT